MINPPIYAYWRQAFEGFGDPFVSSRGVIEKNMRTSYDDFLRLFCMDRSGQSRLGIASLILSVSSILFMLVLFAIAGVLEMSEPGGLDENSAAAVILGLFIFACLGSFLVSIGLGIAGILQKQRVRIFAFIGTALSSASFIVMTSFLAIGMALDL